MPQTYIPDLKALDHFASEFVQELKAGDIICLYGQLGAGKTTFVKALVSQLGCADMVSSPTFVLHNVYHVDKFPIKRIHHIDAYRISEPHLMQDMGLTDILSDKESLVLIEWPENISALLPKKRIEVTFHDGEDQNSRYLVVDRREG